MLERRLLAALPTATHMLPRQAALASSLRFLSSATPRPFYMNAHVSLSRGVIGYEGAYICTIGVVKRESRLDAQLAVRCVLSRSFLSERKFSLCACAR